MLLEAVIAGKAGGEKTVLDSSSGNAGIAYAMIGAMMKIPIQIVVPGNASRERKLRIRAHGATLVQTDPMEGYDEALREGHRIAHSDPDRFFHCDQYSNENNWMAHYHETAAEILQHTEGRLTHFVSGIGTGGTITGIGRRLKKDVPGVEIVQIVPEDFPGIEGLKPLESPADIVPKILDASVVDHKVRVTSADAARMCALLARHGLFAGQSSGAYLQGVYETAKRIRKGMIVTMLNDIGERYMSTQLWVSANRYTADVNAGGTPAPPERTFGSLQKCLHTVWAPCPPPVLSLSMGIEFRPGGRGRPSRVPSPETHLKTDTLGEPTAGRTLRCFFRA
jgi:cysteine synthase B